MIYSILFVSTISFKLEKNYHTIAPSLHPCTTITLTRCNEFVMFSSWFATITTAISSNLGMDVSFFVFSNLREINLCVVVEIYWIIAYATGLVPTVLASPNKWSPISLIFSWTLMIGLGISLYDAKYFSLLTRSLLSLVVVFFPRTSFRDKLYEKHLFLLVCMEI